MAYRRILQEESSPCGENIPNERFSEEASCIALRRLNVCGELRSVNIRLVASCEKVQAACNLINDRYAWRGYGANHRIPSGSNHMTFTAEIDDAVVGTITLAVDSEHGLAADRCFRAEMNRFREMPGARICELTKFAFSATIQSKELMAALFHIVFVYGHRTFGCTDLFIEVNPRHVRFYDAMLGFQRIGALRTNDSVAAPAQLMRLEVAAIRENIDRAAGGVGRASAHSLYPFFFSPAEESGIYRRLTAAGGKSASTASDIAREKTIGASQPADSPDTFTFQEFDVQRTREYRPPAGVIRNNAPLRRPMTMHAAPDDIKRS